MRKSNSTTKCAYQIEAKYKSRNHLTRCWSKRNTHVFSIEKRVASKLIQLSRQYCWEDVGGAGPISPHSIYGRQSFGTRPEDWKRSTTVRDRSDFSLSRCIMMSIPKDLQTTVESVIAILLYLAIKGITSKVLQPYSPAMARFSNPQAPHPR